MLDKKIPYYNVIMLRKQGTKIKEVICPKGYDFVSYQTGDEKAWAEIETSVLEFDNVEKSLSYFDKYYKPYQEELKKRCLFIENDKHEKVATFTIWWDDDYPSVHWVAVKPNYQGKGLGKAIVYQGIKHSITLLGDVDIYLHTQTWSYKAIGIYQKAGFKILEEGSFAHYKNDYEAAIKILKDKLEVNNDTIKRRST